MGLLSSSDSTTRQQDNRRTNTNTFGNQASEGSTIFQTETDHGAVSDAVDAIENASAVNARLADQSGDRVAGIADRSGDRVAGIADRTNKRMLRTVGGAAKFGGKAIEAAVSSANASRNAAIEAADKARAEAVSAVRESQNESYDLVGDTTRGAIESVDRSSARSLQFGAGVLDGVFSDVNDARRASASNLRTTTDAVSESAGRVTDLATTKITSGAVDMVKILTLGAAAVGIAYAFTR